MSLVWQYQQEKREKFIRVCLPRLFYFRSSVCGLSRHDYQVVMLVQSTEKYPIDEVYPAHAYPCIEVMMACLN